MNRAIYFVFVFLIACEGKQDRMPETVISDTVEVELPKDFIDFYQRFHDDSLFQLAHIMFPLAGLPANVDSLTETDFKWLKSQWKMHKSLDPDLRGYQKEFRKFEDGIIMESITQRQVGVGMQRRFAKMDGDWMLIYYAAMRQL